MSPSVVGVRSRSVLLAVAVVAAGVVVKQNRYPSIRNAEAQTTSGVKTAGVHCRVVDSLTGKPLRDVHVAIGAHSDVTNDAGLVLFSGIPRGRYTLYLSSPGYVAVDRQQQISIDDSESAYPVVAAMMQASSIEGHVEDRYGHPVPNVNVEVLAEHVTGVTRDFNSRYGPSQTDVNGTFHFTAVLAGTYYVRVSDEIRIGRDDMHKTRLELDPPAFNRTYYPDSPNIENAVPVHVAAADHVVGLKVHLRPATFYTVRAALSGAENNPSHPVAVELDEVAGPNNSSRVFLRIPELPVHARVDPSGKVAILRVMSGSYLASVRTAQMAFPVGGAPVMVTDHDVDNIQLPVAPGKQVSGTVVYPTGRRPSQPITLFLTGSDAGGEIFSKLEIQNSDHFSIKGLVDGTFRILERSGAFVVNEVDVGTKKFRGSKFEFRGETDYGITVRLGVGSKLLGGITSPTGEPVDHGLVSVVAKPEDEMDLSGLQFAPVDTDGSFSVSHLEPGDYRVCAWNEAGTRPRMIVETRKYWLKLNRSCIALSVDSDQVQRVAVRQISTADFK